MNCYHSFHVAIVTLGLQSTASAAIVVGWDAWGNPDTSFIEADQTAGGFTGRLAYGTDRINSGFSSTDGTFGTVPGATGEDSGLLVREADGDSFPLRIINNSGSSWLIETLNFDFGRRGGSYDTISVTYVSGGLGPDSTQVASVTNAPDATGNEADQPDYNFDLSASLTDLVLADGEDALFSFTFSGQSDDSTSSILDNLAFTGTQIPEPGTIALLAMSAGLFLRRRR